MKYYHSLPIKQKESIGLLQVGTFLEYFDLMLYVHMAVLLNELFFQKQILIPRHFYQLLLFVQHMF